MDILSGKLNDISCIGLRIPGIIVNIDIIGIILTIVVSDREFLPLFFCSAVIYGQIITEIKRIPPNTGHTVRYSHMQVFAIIKQVVIKESCDSFDIMPESEANALGKDTVLASKIDEFVVSFSGGKDSQVLLDLVARVVPNTDFSVIYSDTGYELPTSLELYEELCSNHHEPIRIQSFQEKVG